MIKFKLSLITIFLLALYFGAFALKTPKKGEGLQYDLLSIKKDSTSIVKLNKSPNGVLKILGRPDSVSSYYAEIPKQIATFLFYGDNRLEFLEDYIDSFLFTSSLLEVGYKGKYIKVGNDIKMIAAMFPAANDFKTPNDIYFILPLMGEEGDINENPLRISFDPHTSKITRIELESVW